MRSGICTLAVAGACATRAAAPPPSAPGATAKAPVVGPVAATDPAERPAERPADLHDDVASDARDHASGFVVQGTGELGGMVVDRDGKPAAGIAVHVASRCRQASGSA